MDRTGPIQFANAQIRATLAGINNAASLLGKLSAAKRKKKLGKGMSEARTHANKRHGNIDKNVIIIAERSQVYNFAWLRPFAYSC